MKTFLSGMLCFCALSASAQQTQIRLNQVGYFPNQEKVAVVESSKNVKSFVVTNESGKKVLKGKVTSAAKSPFSGETGYRVDLSSITQPGRYILEVNKTKAAFTVSDDALDAVCKAAMKAYYYQRASMPIEKTYAGEWARPAAHPDEAVIVHPSAASSNRPAGTTISSPKGWYDAGDYNKYIVNSSFTIGQMLTLYPMIKRYVDRMNLGIPESGNGMSDFLNEIYYNLEWMLTMQDEDGGVYHKLTTPEFEDFVMPSECRKPRYVVKKTTCATLDFAATMALASRVFQPYERQTPGFSEKAINAAKKAYIWALKNPKVYYSQKELNNQYDPKISTGEYGDNDSNDEFFWAACELYNATQTNIYLLEIKSRKPKTFKAPVWGEVGSMGIMSWLTYWSNNPRPRTPEITEIFDYGKQMLVKWADEYINGVDKTIYLSPFGNKKEDFHWASMAEGAATEAIILAQAFNLTKEKKYLVNARRNADYIFGRNATGYCFVTGFGDKSPMHPHHRISASDNVEKPVPGLLVGGPNAKANEGDFYESEQPDKRYADTQGSFMTNEIAINWNSALVVMTAALETFKSHSY